MGASLVEMVLAIAIAGIIFALAIIPTTQTILAYQEAETELRKTTAHAMAAVRAEQTSASIWRDADPPENHGSIVSASSARLHVGEWRVRWRDTLVGIEQYRSQPETPATIIAEPFEPLPGVAELYVYLDNSGSWSASPPPEEIIAVRYGWFNPDSGRRYGGLMVAPDRAFSAGLILLSLPDTSEPYDREDYEQTVDLSLGSWQ